MSAPRAVGAFVQRLEDRIAEVVREPRGIALAYSGGLASTLIAMVARKRCELSCIVAGRKGSPDVRAAEEAKDYLDYRIEMALLDRGEVRRIRRGIAGAHPQLTPREQDALVPVHTVVARARGRVVLAGFGSPKLRAEMVRALRAAEVRIPLQEIARGWTLPRGILRAAALELGLPRPWAHTAHRPPGRGAGIEAFLPRIVRKGR